MNDTKAISRSVDRTDLGQPLFHSSWYIGEPVAELLQPRYSTKEHPLFVPNIVHAVFKGDEELKFFEYLSLKSVRTFINPEKYFVHVEHGPGSMHGYWWRRALKEVSCVLKLLGVR